MIKTLSFTEVQKFHGQIAQKLLNDLRNSDSEYKDADSKKIQWAYSYETTEGTPDIRQDSLALDRNIRAAKLLQLDPKLNGDTRDLKGKFVSLFSKKEERKNELSEKLENYFSKIIAISLMIKIGDYERFQIVEKTSLFESKIREEMGKLKF